MIPTKALRSADLELRTTVGAAPYGGLDGEQAAIGWVGGGDPSAGYELE